MNAASKQHTGIYKIANHLQWVRDLLVYNNGMVLKFKANMGIVTNVGE